MKKFKNLVIGGIETKIFNLILITVILISGAFIAGTQYQSQTLTQLAAETNVRQQTAITETTSMVMDAVVTQSMDSTIQLEAAITDVIFRDAKARVTVLAEYAQKLLDDPEAYPLMPYAGPDPANEGKLAPLVTFADNVDPEDPALKARVGLMANMLDAMFSICAAQDGDNAYIALPEGVFLEVSRDSGSWVGEDGKPVSYDARTRFWYQQAVSAGELIFTDIEVDAITGDLSLVCAVPLYDAAGELEAVIGTDLFLDDMEHALLAAETDGSYRFVVNQSGHAIFTKMPGTAIEVRSSDNAADLRSYENEALAALVTDAMQGKTEVRKVQFGDDIYYMIGTPLKTVGWTLISVFSEEKAAKPVEMLEENYRQIQEGATAAYREKNDRIKTTVTVALLSLMIALLGVSLLLGRRIVKPLNIMTQRISEISEGNAEFKMEDAYRTGDEIEVLAQSFANLSHKTVEYVREVLRVTAEKERIGTELHMAAQIQESMLPHLFPPFPDRKEFDLFASMNPAREVGGDFYDFFLIDDDHLCLVMADVSGKGVPGALFMMISKVILQSCAMLGQGVSEILTKTNEALCSNNKVEMFVTVWLGVLEISTGKIIAANAGHEFPAIYRKDGAFQLYKDKHGFVVGGMEGIRYKEYELQMNPGDKLFLYTDGVPEATDANKKMFGTERMIAALNEHVDRSPKEILHGVRQAVDAFVGDEEQFDDLTMLCLEYRGAQGFSVTRADPG